jgi:hypothetical protein
MAFCTVEEIRAQNDKLASAVDIPDEKIETSITHAKRIVKTDIISILSPSEFDAIDGLETSTSNVIKTLVIYKSAEFTIVALYGSSRKIDEVSDVQYFQKLYKDLLKKIMSGEIEIDIPDELTTATIAKDYPTIGLRSNNTKFYPRKGVPGFYPDGVEESYKDDRFK